MCERQMEQPPTPLALALIGGFSGPELAYIGRLDDVMLGKHTISEKDAGARRPDTRNGRSRPGLSTRYRGSSHPSSTEGWVSRTEFQADFQGSPSSVSLGLSLGLSSRGEEGGRERGRQAKYREWIMACLLVSFVFSSRVRLRERKTLVQTLDNGDVNCRESELSRW